MRDAVNRMSHGKNANTHRALLVDMSHTFVDVSGFIQDLFYVGFQDAFHRVSQHTAAHCNTLPQTAIHLQQTAARCNTLQPTESFVLTHSVEYNVLQCVAACCSMLQRVAACCSMLQRAVACC